LELPASRAVGFFGIVGAATLGGGALAVTRIDPIAMLFWSAVINGLVAVPIKITLMLVVSSAKGRQALVPTWLIALGWLASTMMVASAGLFLVFAPKPSAQVPHDPERPTFAATTCKVGDCGAAGPGDGPGH
jgi:hypothetical protein